MKKWIILLLTLMIILSGCNQQPATEPEEFADASLNGWTVSEDASYELTPVQGFANDLTKTGAYYLSTGRILPAFSAEDGALQVQRYYPQTQTESCWRGLFFTHEEMIASDGTTVSVDITPKVGALCGICVGTDGDLNNGYAVMLDLAKQNVQILRVNKGVLTSLSEHQSDTVTNLVQISSGETYRLNVTYWQTDENVCRIKVGIGNKELLDTELSGYGVSAGRGHQVSLVAADMQCSFAQIRIADDSIDPAKMNASVADAQIVDGAFKGSIESETFEIGTRMLCFKVGGGQDSENLTVSLIDADTGKTLCSSTGSGSEEMIRQVWDVSGHQGKSCYIRITDNSRSAHLNVDSFFASNTAPLDEVVSILSSQVGYSADGAKKVYLRAPEGTKLSQTSFAVRDPKTWQPVFEGTVSELGAYWESHWWLLDFSELSAEGKYVVTVGDGPDSLATTVFSVQEAALMQGSALDTSLTQLDLRRSPGKLGWRDSSTDGLREIHAQVMVVHTMLDLLEEQTDALSEYDRARVIDNIAFGLSYLFEAQERTDDPLTDGRFVHDLYPSEFSAHHLRTWFDTTYAMSALARAYPVLQELGMDELAEQTKTAFDVSFDMCVLRPHYLEEEFMVESVDGYQNVVSAMRNLYYIKSFSWNFSKELRTRDKMMFLRACTYMAQADEDPKYLEQAKKYAKEVSNAQYTELEAPIDGAYGCFYEFENSDEAMMLEWIQSTNLLLGNQTPTDLSAFADLLELCPEDPDAAMWYNTIVTWAEGYVKNTAELTPLGIYPIAAYHNQEQAGIKFFQTISHGASSHYGLSAHNIEIIARFLGDGMLSDLAQNNAQFQTGLNPGFPTDTTHENWKSYSLLYLIGSRYYSGYFNGGAYIPPIGSGFNGFSASTQFTVETIDKAPDLPLGIIDSQGGWQFNEDYLTHGMGYTSGVAAVESPVKIPVVTTLAGVPVSAQVRFNGGSVTTDDNGEAVITGLGANKEVTLEFVYGTAVIPKTVTLVSGTLAPIHVDFAWEVGAQWSVPAVIEGNAQAVLTVTNLGTETVSAELYLSADGVSMETSTKSLLLQPGEVKTITLTLTAEEAAPYLLYAYLKTSCDGKVVTAAGITR